MSDAPATPVEGLEPEPLVIPSGVSIANHPRARVAIRRARARAALVVFGLVLLLCLRAGVPGPDAVMRALLAGIVGNLAAWAIGLVLWKHILLAELQAAHRRRAERRRALAEQHAARQAAAAAQAQTS
jgi:hypothetical protein